MRRRLLLMLATLCAVTSAATPALAVTTPAQVSDQLGRSPLFVDPSLEDAVSDEQRRAVLRAIKAAPYPVFIALVPLTPGDRYGGKSSRFLDVIHGRLGRDGVYVTVTERVLNAQGYGIDEERPSLSRAITVGNFESDDFEESQVAKVQRFAEVLSAPDLAARYQRTEALLEKRRESYSSPSFTATASDDPDEDDRSGGGGWLLALGVGAAFILTLGSLLVVRRRHARPVPEDEPVIPARVFEHARTAQAGDLREEIEQRLLAFAEVIDREDVPSSEPAQERQQHALDAYAAARRVLQSQPKMVDLVGALVLVEQGSRALAAAQAREAGRDEEPAAPLCFFDPRHPGQTRPRAWERGLTVPACAACTSHLRSDRPPETLLDAGQPWFEADSLWARTGFGVFEPDLAQRVIRGELRR